MDRSLKTEEELDKTRDLLHQLESSSWFSSLLENYQLPEDPRLKINLDGIEFKNPVIIGPGWDKLGRLIKISHLLGFGGIEVGTIVKEPQPGNPKPRFFMMGPGVTLNRFGFNSPGVDVVAKNLSNYNSFPIPVGISLGKNKEVTDEDAPAAHTAVLKKLYQFGDYFVINVSSPNTPNLRRLQGKKPIQKIITAVIETMENLGKRKPLFVKVAPDLENEALSEIVEVALELKISGIIASNTTINREIKSWYGKNWADEAGGLAGDDPDYRMMVTKQIAFIRKLAGKKLVIIGAGGVKDARTAVEKILAGANAVQVVSSLISDGPMIGQKINQGLLDWMENHKVKNISEIVGVDTKKYL